MSINKDDCLVYFSINRINELKILIETILSSLQFDNIPIIFNKDKFYINYSTLINNIILKLTFYKQSFTEYYCKTDNLKVCIDIKNIYDTLNKIINKDNEYNLSFYILKDDNILRIKIINLTSDIAKIILTFKLSLDIDVIIPKIDIKYDLSCNISPISFFNNCELISKYSDYIKLHYMHNQIIMSYQINKLINNINIIYDDLNISVSNSNNQYFSIYTLEDILKFKQLHKIFDKIIVKFDNDTPLNLIFKNTLCKFKIFIIPIIGFK